MIDTIMSLLSDREIHLSLNDDGLAYKAPKGALTDEIKSLIVEHKTAIIESLKQQRDVGLHGPMKVIRRDSTCVHPLSFAQQRLWLLDRIDDGSTHYNMPCALRLSGCLDVGVLDRVFVTILERHESLRTRFSVDADDVPRQTISAVPAFHLRKVDLRDVAPGKAAERVNVLAREEASRRFDLSADLMLRAMLLTLDTDEYVLLVTLHHVASDGWSTVLLVKEFCSLYSAYAQNLVSPLKPLPIQYVDYAHWQRDWLQGAVLEEQLGYWQRQLVNLPKVHNLPLDRPRPVSQTFVGGVCLRRLQAPLLGRLNSSCRSSGATLFMGLHAAFVAFLSRYSNEQDIVVGSPIANREQAEVAELIGFFVNTLVLRSDLSSEISFAALIQQSKRTLLDAYSHQQVPFEKIVERLQPDRSLSHTPLFQIMLVLQNEQSPPSLPGLKVCVMPQPEIVTKYDITLKASQDDQGMSLAWEYNVDLFDDDTVARMARHFERLLANMLTHPDSPISSLDMLDDIERHQLLESWNDTAVPLERDRHLHTLIEKQVTRHPERRAVFDEHSSFSYGALNATANGLAHSLIELGVEPGDVVPVMISGGCLVPLALLAVMKAGGVFAPIDLRWPQQRIQTVLDRLAPRVVLQDRIAAQRFGDTWRACVVHQDDLLACPNNLSLRLPDEAPIYIIHTSGSTGEPKGAINLHVGIVNRLRFMDRYFSANREVVMQTTHHCFDSSVWQFFWPLLSGGSCFIPNADRDIEPGALLALIARHGVTVTDFTPALFATLVDELQAREWPRDEIKTLKALVVGGDAMIVDAARRFSKAYPNIDLVNAYGPTETSIGVVFYQIPTPAPSRIPIGRPIDNVRVYVLDRHRAPVPIGVQGELYIAGACVGGGYWRAPGATGQSFVSNPYHVPASPSSSALMYRTGDLVRWRTDGNLDYIGRVDQQVKVRGFRVELGEIEACLMAQPGLRKAVVVARDCTDRRLLACVVLDDTGTLPRHCAGQVLRAALLDALPDYMVPTGFIVLDKLPLAASGKVDRKRLALLEPSDSQHTYVAPLHSTERVICEIWQELLGVDRVGVTDNFFDLGGHSLTATRFASRLSRALNISVPLRAVFSDQTPAALAQTLQKLEKVDCSPPLRRVAGRVGVPLSFAQQRLWLLDNIDGGSAHYNMPSAIKLSGKLDRAALSRAFTALVQRHESLRTCFRADDYGQPCQSVQTIDEFFIHHTDLRGLDDRAKQTQIDQLSRVEANSTFCLADDLMIRAHLLTLDPDRFILLITLHHIASDGWSIAILVREFVELYTAFAQGLDSPLPLLNFQYVDYAHWQRGWLQGEVLDAQLRYWEKQLSGLPVAHSLPFDRPRPRQQSFVGATLHSHIDTLLHKALVQLCRVHGATLFMGLHAAFSVLLSRYSGEADIVVGTPIANREQPEIAELIGCFVNTLVLRSDLGGDPTFGEVLQRSKNTLLDAYTHQQAPFEQIVERLQPDRHTNHAALFQIMLVLQNNESTTLHLPGVALELVEQCAGIAKYDLTLLVTELPEGLALAWEYNTDLFDASTIEDMARHFAVLLNALTSHPQQSISHAPLMNEAEQEKLWHVGKQGSNLRQALTPRLLQARFLEQVKKQGGGIAVKTSNKTLTYEALESLSAGLGCRLIREGCQPNGLVAVVMDKCWEQVVAVLGILRSGAAYLPIDAQLPADRIRMLLELGEISQVVTTSDYAHVVPNATTVSIICVDDDLDSIDKQCDDDLGLDSRAGVEDLAYVIFTSGSTGIPKGVMISHRSAANTIDDLCARFDINSGDSILALSNLNFDLSVFDIFGLLSVGGTVVLPQSSETKDVDAWRRYLESESITLWNTVPAYMQLLTKIAPPASDGALRLIMMAGDWIPSSLPSQIAALYPRAKQINLGGNTEASIFSSIYPIDDVRGFGKSVPYGKALSNQHMFVFGSDMCPLPYGVTGEIYIGGLGVALGYWRDAQRTANSFIVHPLTGDRMYKTGDLGRLLRDGNIEFLGRRDFQVKLRGFRIELGEIDNALIAQEQVKDAVTAVCHRPDGDSRLVAYVVLHTADLPEGDPHALVERLRLQLARILPDYMLPAAFVFLEKLPLSANGKVDRKALPKPDLTSSRQQYVPPTTKMEHLLCQIWQETLGITRVSSDDNFFELGGHSLLVMQVIASLQRQEVAATARQVFAAPTLAHLAASLAQPEHAAKRIVAMPANLIPSGCTRLTPEMLNLVELNDAMLEQLAASVPGGARNIQDIYPLGPLQEGMLFHNLLNPKVDPYVIPTLFEVPNKNELASFLAAMQHLLDRHDVLRTAFFWQGLPQPVQVVLRQVSLPVVVAELGDAEDALAHMLDMSAPQRQCTDLARAPLLSLHVAHQRGDGCCLVLLRLHHMVFDHVGMDILLRELTSLRAGQGHRLPAPVPYRAFIAQTLHHCTSEAQVFFQDMLADVEEPSIAFGLTDIYGDGTTAVEIRESVPAHVDVRLRALAKALQVTPATLFHSAWALVLAAACGQDSVIFGSVVSGRLQGTLGVERTLGLFINTLPIRITLTDLDAAQLVRHTHQMLLGLLCHEHASLAQAQRCTKLARHVPLFNTLLNCRHSNRDTTFKVLGGQERTSYPLYLGIDDYADEFVLDLQLDAKMDAKRVMGYLQRALVTLVNALEMESSKPVLCMTLIEEDSRASWTLRDQRSAAIGRHLPVAVLNPQITAALAQIWQTLLAVEPPQADDDFFEHGGNSLLAIRLVSNVYQQLKIELSVRQVFVTPTFAALVDHISMLWRHAR